MFVRRILLIDDEPYIRDVVAHCISRAGYDLDAPAVEDPEAARIARSHALSGQYDVLLLDLRLPTIDAFELLDTLHAIRSDTRAIAVAAFLPDQIRSSLRRHGCHHFVEKPFTFSQLRTEIDACLVPA